MKTDGLPKKIHDKCLELAKNISLIVGDELNSLQQEDYDREGLSGAEILIGITAVSLGMITSSIVHAVDKSLKKNQVDKISDKTILKAIFSQAQGYLEYYEKNKNEG